MIHLICQFQINLCSRDVAKTCRNVFTDHQSLGHQSYTRQVPFFSVTGLYPFSLLGPHLFFLFSLSFFCFSLVALSHASVNRSVWVAEILVLVKQKNWFPICFPFFTKKNVFMQFLQTWGNRLFVTVFGRLARKRIGKHFSCLFHHGPE